jgi:enoyl-CoA hydratase
MKMGSWETINVSSSDDVLTLTFNRPDRLNAFNPTLSSEFAEAIRLAGQMPAIRAIVLTGAGRAFCAGGDMTEVRETPASFAEGAVDARSIVFGLLDCEKPIICRMNGDAIGLGATIALLCDIVIAADSARIGDPHVKMGLVAGDGGALLWPMLAGPMVAKYYLLTGDLMPAPQAQAHGLITKAVASALLDEEVAMIAKKLTEGAPLAIRWTKRSINSYMQSIGKLQFDLSLGYEGMTLVSEDHAEAIAAFKAKRKPVFKGR